MSEVVEPASDWTSTLLGVLVCPRATMRRLAMQGGSGLAGAAALVTVVSAASGLALAGGRFTGFTPISLVAAIVCGVIGWLSMTGTLALAASAFGVPASRVRASFVTTGWAMLPFLFLLPLSVYRLALGPVAAILVLAPLAWSYCLLWLALHESYDLRSRQALFLIVLLPQLATFTIFWWTIQALGVACAFVFGDLST